MAAALTVVGLWASDFRTNMKDDMLSTMVSATAAAAVHPSASLWTSGSIFATMTTHHRIASATTSVFNVNDNITVAVSDDDKRSNHSMALDNLVGGTLAASEFGNDTLGPYYDPDASINYDSLIFYFWLWKVVAPTVFGAFAIFGTIGNALVVYVVVSRPQMRTVTNVLLVSLAIADIAFLAVCVPSTAYRYAADTWPFGDAACQCVNYLLYVTTYVTVYTLVAITGVRFASVVYPESTGWLRTRRNAVILSVVVWAVALIGNGPLLPVFVVRTFGDFAWCGIEKDAVRPTLVSFFVIGYVVPLTAIGLLNVRIILHLAVCRRGAAAQAAATTAALAAASSGTAAASAAVDGVACKSRRRHMRTVRIVIPLVLVFGLSWLPLHVQSLTALHTSLPDGHWSVLPTSSCCIILMSVSAVVVILIRRTSNFFVSASNKSQVQRVPQKNNC